MMLCRDAHLFENVPQLFRLIRHAAQVVGAVVVDREVAQGLDLIRDHAGRVGQAASG